MLSDLIGISVGLLMLLLAFFLGFKSGARSVDNREDTVLGMNIEDMGPVHYIEYK